MASSQPTHSAQEAAPQFLMTSLEHDGLGYKPAASYPNSSTSSASSPIESEYLTHTNMVGRYQTPATSSKVPSFLQHLLPPRFIQNCEKYALWLRGPQPPRQFKIRPLCSRFQRVPIRLLDRWVAKNYKRFWVLFGFHVLWILLFVTTIYDSASRDGTGTNGLPVKLSCISRLW
jgi:hypothetical protein